MTDSEVVPGIGVEALDLVQLTLVVEGHGVHVASGGVAHVGRHLGRVGEDDAACVHAEVDHLGDLGLGRTVEPCAQRCQYGQHQLTVVALHCCSQHNTPLIIHIA